MTPPALSDISEFLAYIVGIFYSIGGIIFLVILILIGFRWMTSQGNDEVLNESRQRFLYWIVGFVLYFLSAVIVTFILQFFGVKDCNGNDITNPGFTIVFQDPC
jgi:type IV secretory pathway VirB2 component (pilin)